MVRGDDQIPHVHFDPDSISSPVADQAAILTALALAAGENLIIEHWHLEFAFLHGFFGPNEPLYVD